jgi:hypothetical protein
LGFPTAHDARYGIFMYCNYGDWDQDLDPDVLGPVMAISVGNSIYAARRLVSNPYQDLKDVDVVRALGILENPEFRSSFHPPT